MEDESLSIEERQCLLRLARQAIQAAVCGEKYLPIKLDELTPLLRKPGASFVTLTRGGELRGCIGALEPYLPLAEDVMVHAAAAALEDYRFLPVQEHEIPEIEIEISRLTTPSQLEYTGPEDLVNKLRPDIDGVILRDGLYRATYLPQVWAKIPDPALFLSSLCQKMGASGSLWRYKKIQVLVYQVEEFHEELSR